MTWAVPRWIRAALTGRPVVLYWQGLQYRDYVFVEDIARAHVQVLGMAGLHAYNLGTGHGILMRDVVSSPRADGQAPPYQRRRSAGWRPMRLVADVSRIRREVGWQAETGLREGLLRTVRFYEGHRHLWDLPSFYESRA